MARKLEPGDKVAVNTKQGKGHGTYLGTDDRSGMPIVALDKIKVDNGVEKVELKDVQAYVAHGAIRRD